MERLTYKRANGIKSGYWSPNKKDELVQRLAEYENTGMEPECMKKNEWIPVAEKLPETADYVLVSFKNFSLPAIGRYEVDDEGDGAWYLQGCDDGDTCCSAGLFVNAWMPLPEAYKEELE